MPEGPTDTGRRFAADLRKIREARGISLQDMHDETKIPRGLLSSFEETGLFDHPMFNRVYLRSFVRTYAEVTGIAPERALASLEDALNGTYRGALAQEYLGEAPPAAAPPPAPPTSEAEAEEVVKPRPAPEEPSRAAEDAAAAQAREAQAREERAEEARRAREEEAAAAAGGAAAGGAAAGGRLPEPPKRPAPPRRPNRPDYQTREAPNRQWIYLALGVVALGLIIWLVLSLVDTGETEAPVAANVDTMAVAEDTVDVVPVAEPQPAVVLGDTMHVEVIAANGPVREIRVTVDDDLRRPYWIEEGQSRMFTATDRIVIEEQLEQIALEIEGHEYPFRERLDDQGRVVITREGAQEFFNNLASR